MSKQQIITLTTDFGLSDEFVAVMKGVLLCYAPAATLVDISHSIQPQDVREGAWMVSAAYPYFPPATVHLAVIDPGVGTDRAILALQADNHFFVGPDNGLFTPLLQQGVVQQAHRVENQDLFLPSISPTFHGRDIMAPVAARIAQGMELQDIGSRIEPDQCCRIDIPAAELRGQQIRGTIIHIDHFGNMRSSITSQDIAALSSKEEIRIQCGTQIIKGLSGSYSSARAGHLLALIDSRNHLEIAVRNGNAANTSGCRMGDEVIISLAC